MKVVIAAAVALALLPAAAYAAEMKPMDMKDMSPSGMAKDTKTDTHVAKGNVKAVDAKAGTVTLDHQPVKSLNWPAMTMKFKVRDKAVMDKLTPGKNVEVQFEQRGKDYVITGAK
jgi:Cu(I)/Ag(I) efflux system periplasmic protein CusF